MREKGRSCFIKSLQPDVHQSNCWNSETFLSFFARSFSDSAISTLLQYNHFPLFSCRTHSQHITQASCLCHRPIPLECHFRVHLLFHCCPHWCSIPRPDIQEPGSVWQGQEERPFISALHCCSAPRNLMPQP